MSSIRRDFLVLYILIIPAVLQPLMYKLPLM